MELKTNDFVKTLSTIRRQKTPELSYRIPVNERDPESDPFPVTRTVTLPEFLAYKGRQARRQLHKKTTRDIKPYVYRLGYNHCIGKFAGSCEFPTLSGSSINRKKPRNKARLFLQQPEKLTDALHVFSKRSRGKVSDKAKAFHRSAPGDQRFLTLTFIQHVDDKTGCEILNKFLTVVRKEAPGFQYLWVAEHQPDNPARTIHFHIIMNRRLSVRRYNALWVMQQYNAGLSNGEISYREIKARYDHDMTAAFRPKDPDSVQAVLNPLDVRKAYGITALSNYLTKYITKQTRDEQFGCLNWHCSRRVSRLFTMEVVSPSTFAYLESFANWKLDKKTGECSPAQTINQQFFRMVYVNNKTLPLKRLQQLELVNKWLINGFDTDRIPIVDDALYRKIHFNEKDLCTDSAVRCN